MAVAKAPGGAAVVGARGERIPEEVPRAVWCDAAVVAVPAGVGVGAVTVADADTLSVTVAVVVVGGTARCTAAPRCGGGLHASCNTLRVRAAPQKARLSAAYSTDTPPLEGFGGTGAVGEVGCESPEGT